jgi:hypothetical protein
MSFVKPDKLVKAIYECYQLLYENSEPKADFQKLMKNATLNELGQKTIDYDSYIIDDKKASEIIETVAKKYKIKDYQKNMFKTSIILGCSPKFKLNLEK